MAKIHYGGEKTAYWRFSRMVPYDPMGNPSQRTSQGQVHGYTANNLNQLATATGPNSTDVAGKVAPELVAPFNVSVNGQSATVDDKGDWIANVALVQGANQISVTATDRFARTASEVRNVTLAPPPVFSYDSNGNMLGDNLWQYSWNQENRMISLTTNHTNDTKVENIYDGFGRRRIKKVYENEILTSETHFVYDNLYIIAETDGSGNVLRRYIRNEDQLLAVEDIALGKTFYYCMDGNKNVTELIDSEGTIAAHYEYDPFGNIVKESGSYAETNPFRFSSEYFDKETGLIAYLYRDYSPKYARWMTRDPIQNTDFDLITYDANKFLNDTQKQESENYIDETNIDFDYFRNHKEENLSKYINPYLFCINSAIGKTDSRGLDITLETGNNVISPLNNALHQQVCVDIWERKKECNEENKWDCCHKDKACFSFGMVGLQLPQFSKKWLGWNSPVVGAVLKGIIYGSKPVSNATITGTLKTTMKQDFAWGTYMAISRLGTFDAYSIARHDCRTYSQWEFRDAPFHMN